MNPETWKDPYIWNEAWKRAEFRRDGCKEVLLEGSYYIVHFETRAVGELREKPKNPILGVQEYWVPRCGTCKACGTTYGPNDGISRCSRCGSSFNWEVEFMVARFVETVRTREARESKAATKEAPVPQGGGCLGPLLILAGVVSGPYLGYKAFFAMHPDKIWGAFGGLVGFVVLGVVGILLDDLISPDK